MGVGEVAVERRYVSRHDVRRFAWSIGAADPVHHDVEAARAAGYADLLAPSWFFSSLGLSFARLVGRDALGDEGLPLTDDLAGRRVVAGETEVVWSGDILAEQTIDVEQTLTGVDTRDGSKGTLELYRYTRRYLHEGRVLVEEKFTRIAR